MAIQNADKDEEQLSPEDLRLIARFIAQCNALRWGTQTEISLRLDSSPRTISAIFTRRRVPNTRLLRTAAGLGMDIAFVVTGEAAKQDTLIVGQLERDIDRIRTVLRSIVAIAENELPGSRTNPAREATRPRLTREQEQLLAKYTNADAQIRSIVDGILARVEPPPPIAEKPS